MDNEEQKWDEMIYFDYRLGKILSDNRLEQAEAIRRSRREQSNTRSSRERLGLLLIALGRRLTQGKAKAA